MTILTKGLVDYLEEEGIGAFGEDLYVGTRPSSPINCVTLYDTGGFIPRKDTTSDPTVQIITRNKSYPLANEKALGVHDLLKEKYNFWLVNDEIWVLQSEAQGEPGRIGRDENGNYLFSANYRLWVKYY